MGLSEWDTSSVTNMY
ncbi:hypothetical protein II582_02930 [bacterium]|nr:hypothetical protein [bacterium]